MIRTEAKDVTLIVRAFVPERLQMVAFGVGYLVW
jgi:hypothetical protein